MAAFKDGPHGPGACAAEGDAGDRLPRWHDTRHEWMVMAMLFREVFGSVAANPPDLNALADQHSRTALCGLLMPKTGKADERRASALCRARYGWSSERASPVAAVRPHSA
jgi:hypothetical protein